MKKGSVIVVPTDTVYGIACKLFDNTALERIYQIKGRDQSKQIPLLISNIKQLEDIILNTSYSKVLMHHFWPGPLTIIFRTNPSFRKKTHEETIAVRMPNHAFLLGLIEKEGVLRVTSLNRSGEPPLSNLEDIYQQFGTKVDDIYAQDQTVASNLSSTIVDATSQDLKILRQGSITKEQIDYVLTLLEYTQNK